MKINVIIFLLLQQWFIYDSIGRQVVTLEISNMKALELDLKRHGVNSRAAEMIYSAAGCNLKRHQELDRKLDQLINPLELIHANINKVLNKLMQDTSNSSSIRAESTLEMMVKHIFIDDSITEGSGDAEEFRPEQSADQRTYQHNEVEYEPMGSITDSVDPELCKTYKVVADLVTQSKERKHGILKIAHRNYNYDGPSSVSSLARFYVNYVDKYHDERIKVMGLAKLLGDFASIVSEKYFLEDAFKVHKAKCGLEIPHVRRKRNVMQSMITQGKCIRQPGTKNHYYSNLTTFNKVPFRSSIAAGFIPDFGLCREESASWLGAVEKAAYKTILAASYRDGVDACVRISICGPGYATDGSTCIKHANSIDYADVSGLELSVIKGRVKLEELPEELKTLSKRYCSIQGKVISKDKECNKPAKATEKFTLYHVEDKWMITDRDVLIAHGQDVTNLCFYACSEKCGDCTQCKGDESYESVFGKWPSANCSCEYCEDCSDLYMQIGSAKIGVNAVMHAEWPVTIPIKDETVVDCASCKVTCDGRNLKVERDAKFDTLHLCVAEVCRVIDEEKSDFHYRIPNELLHVTDFTLMFFRSDGLGRTSRSVTCLDSHTCKSIHCDVCAERFANPHCYKLINWVVLILIASGLILVIPILCLLYKASKLVVYILVSPARLICKLIRVLFKKCTKSSKSVAASTSVRLNRFMSDEDEEPRRNVNSGSFYVSLALIMLLFVSSTSCCENTVAVDNKVLNCLPSAGSEVKCAVNTVIEIPLSSVGEESCINLSDQAGNVVHLIKFKTISIRQKCAKTVLYYTNDAELKLLNTFRCRNAGECVDDRCEKINPDGPVPVPSVNENKAGFHGCSRVTGFWGKGCFYASQACQFFKIELQNRDGISYEVSKCSEWFWEIKTNTTILDKNGAYSEALTLDTTLPVKSKVGVIQLLSINTPITSFTSKCFIRRLSGNMLTAIAECSERNTPIIGKIGGVQCATPALAERASKSCLLDRNSIQLIPQDDNVVFVNKFTNATELWKANLLPSNLSSSVVSEDKTGQIYIHHTGQSSYNLRIRMSDYKISYTIVQATCEAHFRKLNGCANCGTGAVLVMEVMINNALRSPVTIKCPSAANSGAELALSSNPLVSFKMAFSKAEIDEKCKVICPGNTVEVEVKGTLIGNVIIRKSEDTSFITKGSDFFASIPWFNFGFLRYFYIFLGVLLILPIFYLIYISILGCLNSSFRRCFSVRQKKH